MQSDLRHSGCRVSALRGFLLLSHSVNLVQICFRTFRAHEIACAADPRDGDYSYQESKGRYTTWHTLHCAGADGMSDLYIIPCRCTEINETILNSFALTDISAREWHCTRCQKVKAGHE